MDTKRCAYCHKLLRADTQICSRCGHSTLDKRRKASLKENTYPSLPAASPHRLGHYSGLHPEDQPYQSSFIAVQRPVPVPHVVTSVEDGKDDDIQVSLPHVPRAKEPERILLPHVPISVEDVPTHVQPQWDDEREMRQEQNADADVVVATIPQRVPRTRKLSLEQLEYPERHERPVRITGPIGPTAVRQPNHLIRVLLTLSVIFFLMASGILAFIFIKTHTASAVPILSANPSMLRVNDTFVLAGHGFDANTIILFTHDAANEPILDAKQQPLKAVTDSKGNFSVQIVVPSSWQVGDHTIHATDDAQALSYTTTITVQQPPETSPQLQLSQPTLDLGVDRAGTTSSGQVTLINVGGGQLTWQPSSDAGWLTALPINNSYVFSGHSLVNVTVNRSHLVPKSYTGHITFSQRESNRVVKLTVTMGVKAAPAALNVSPSSLTYSATTTQSVPVQAITLQNSGGQALNWQASATTNDGANWLYVNQANGTIAAGHSQMLNVTVQAQQLAVGSYQGAITLSGGASASLPVFLTVVAPGNLVVSSTSLTFQAFTGQNVTPQSLTLQNSGGQSLNWSATTMITGNATNWLSVTPANGTVTQGGQTTLTVTINSSTLKAGAYQGIVSITSGGSSKLLPVSLTLTMPPAAIIGIQNAGLNFTTAQGTNPISQDFTITNTGNATLNWSATESGNGATFAPLSLSSGSLAPQANAVISVSPIVASYGPITLTSTVTIADSDARSTVASQKLPLTITITSQAEIGVSPQTNFQLDTTNNTQAVTITDSGTATLNWTAAIQADTPATGTSGAVGTVIPGTVTVTVTPISTGSAGTPIPTNGPWLSVDTASGTLTAGQNATIHIICNGTGLTPGTYQGQITLSDSDAGTAVPPRTIYVTFIV